LRTPSVPIAPDRRRLAACERRGGQHGIDHQLPGGDSADRVGELLRRRVLDDEAARAGGHRAPQVGEEGDGQDQPAPAAGPLPLAREPLRLRAARRLDLLAHVALQPGRRSIDSEVPVIVNTT
jgi:hypothetical protein